MSPARIAFVLVLIAVIAVAVWFGLRVERGDVVIGGKDFAEQTIVGEMAALLIEDRTDLTVARKFHLATGLPMKMLRKGELDLYLDYTGTGYVDILGNTYKREDPDAIYAHVKKAYPEKFDAEWLSPLGFKNTYTLTMRRKHAEELGVTCISDLEQHKDTLRAAFDPAFLDRKGDGYPGLKKCYGFAFETPPGQLRIGLMYKECRDGRVDVIDAFSTDGRIDKFDLKVLEDDKRFFPPYDAAFVVRREVFGKHPEIREVLEELAGRISNEEMGRLNYAVEEEDRRARDVAREFLVSKGLLSAEERRAK